MHLYTHLSLLAFFLLKSSALESDEDYIYRYWNELNVYQIRI